MGEFTKDGREGEGERAGGATVGRR
jgi:hypothetical protein